MLKKFAIAIFAILLFSGTAWCDTLIVKRGTEVLIRAAEKIKSNKVSIGQTIRFVVERAVKNENGYHIDRAGGVCLRKNNQSDLGGHCRRKRFAEFLN